jgi:hypothetical protein
VEEKQLGMDSKARRSEANLADDRFFRNRLTFSKNNDGHGPVLIPQVLQGQIVDLGHTNECICAMNLWIVEIRMSDPESGHEDEKEQNESAKWDGYGLKSPPERLIDKEMAISRAVSGDGETKLCLIVKDWYRGESSRGDHDLSENVR